MGRPSTPRIVPSQATGVPIRNRARHVHFDGPRSGSVVGMQNPSYSRPSRFRPNGGRRIRGRTSNGDTQLSGERTMRVGVVSTYPPRPCGIGTFSRDLREALLGADGVTAVD